MQINFYSNMPRVKRGIKKKETPVFKNGCCKKRRKNADLRHARRHERSGSSS